MVMIVQPEMPNNRKLNLPYALEELSVIKKSVPDDNVVVLGTEPEPLSPKMVLDNLVDTSIVHFACHGKQSLDNPLKSCLILSGGDLELSQIIQQRMPNARLAFLSACETAMGDKKLPDETMHIAASMLFAGFPSVVGTMW
jgi:CHAT domain-containing protein